MATPINILINGESLIEYFDHVSVKFVEGSFCNTIDISVKDKIFWDTFDPIKYFGELKLQVLLGVMNYEFLIEERNTSIPLSGIEFTVWGRSAQALLDKPYAKPVNDEEEKIHPWQLEDTNVSTIISYIMNYCCSDYIRSKVAIHWEVEDFIVYKDTFSSSHNSPIEIISALAGIIGAELVANADGSLTVREYSVQEETSVQEYNDLDHIVSLDDNIVYPIGYNSVIVDGYGTSSSESSAYLTAELQEDDLDGWIYNRYRKVRVYHFHSKGLAVEASVLRGAIRSASSGIESFTEWVLLVWGSGNTTKPNMEGETEIKGDEDIPLLFIEVTYQCRYQDFMLASLLVASDEPLSGVSSYYFSDRTNTTTLSFDYYNSGSENKVIQLDWDENAVSPYLGSGVLMYYWHRGVITDPEILRRSSNQATVMPVANSTNSTSDGPAIMLGAPVNGKELRFRIWGPHWDLVEKCFDSVYNNCTPVGMNQENNTMAFFVEDEEICFSGGEANLSRPYYSGGFISWEIGGSQDVIFEEGMTTVKIAGYDPDYSFAIGRISYNSNYILGKTYVPKEWTASNFYVHLKKNPILNSDGTYSDPEYLSISQSIQNQEIPVGYKDIAILVKDFATDVIVAGAQVFIDGNRVGNTDSEGVLTLQRVTVGDHRITLKATGYLDSDEDELANDTFTITVEEGTTGTSIL